MAENDIYNNEGKYHKACAQFENWIAPAVRGERKYWIRNPDNVQYFHKLAAKLEARDVSYSRRMRLLQTMKIICHLIKKELAEATREDIDELLSYGHAIHRTVESKRCFAIDLKHIWKLLFPDKDERGRDDETITPYVVRHVRTKIDKSRQKMRTDKITPEEYKAIFNALYDRPDIQAILALAYEGLGRPQEILGRRIKDVELHDKYAKIFIAEHGKEGVGFIPVIEGVDAIKRWLNMHPLKDRPESYVFCGRLCRSMAKPLTTQGVNKSIRKALRHIGINKALSIYSFKRNGVTHMRLAGYSDNAIQRRARWTTTKQLHTYDLGNQDDAFEQELKSRGLSAIKREKESAPPSAPAATAAHRSELTSRGEIAPAIHPPVFCRQCGTRAVSGDRYCASCGAAIVRSSEAQSTPLVACRM